MCVPSVSWGISGYTGNTICKRAMKDNTKTRFTLNLMVSSALFLRRGAEAWHWNPWVSLQHARTYLASVILRAETATPNPCSFQHQWAFCSQGNGLSYHSKGILNKCLGKRWRGGIHLLKLVFLCPSHPLSPSRPACANKSLLAMPTPELTQ